ncbi:MAG: pyridoxamine 5'-phosphate oxidase family protein [Chloroflexi bacterium]|nr:pyridoxamine 5'-phosphate oxidase family protein [Chloroflexota bacterium]
MSGASTTGAGAPNPASDRVRVRRAPAQAAYDRATIDAILDASLVAHLGFVVDGQPYVIPVNHARVEDAILLHGAPGSRAFRILAAGAPVCLTVTVLDGLVLARSAYHHSVNYRSAVVLGRAQPITDPAAKLAALEAFSERLVPGRWAEVRPPDDGELRATTVVCLPIEEASAKARTGPPGDDPDDFDRPAWAGVLPLAIRAGTPEPAPDLAPGGPLSPSVQQLLERLGG